MFRVRDKEILSLVPDYKLNLIAPARMTNEEMDKLNTDLREVLMYIKYSKDKTRLREIVNENERFRHLEQKAFRVINAVTNSELFAETKEGEVNMCQAIDEMRKDAYEEGRASMSNAIAEMRKDAYEEGRASMSNAIAEMRKDAYEEGRASMSNAIAEMRRDAWQEGNQAGANENTKIVVENMLKKNMTDQFIMEIADITKEKLSQIKEGFCGMSK